MEKGRTSLKRGDSKLEVNNSGVVPSTDFERLKASTGEVHGRIKKKMPAKDFQEKQAASELDKTPGGPRRITLQSRNYKDNQRN